MGVWGLAPIIMLIYINCRVRVICLHNSVILLILPYSIPDEGCSVFTSYYLMVLYHSKAKAEGEDVKKLCFIM